MIKFFKSLYKAYLYKKLHRVMDRQKEILLQEGRILDEINDNLEAISKSKGENGTVEKYDVHMRSTDVSFSELAAEYRKLEIQKKKLMQKV